MNTLRKALTLLLFLAATTALANDVASHTLILPSVGRTPGAFGSLWRTDVYITNGARQGNAVTVTVVYSRENVPDQVMRVSLAPRGTAILRDIVRDTFGHERAVGLLRIHTESAEAKISARARIVNSGSSVGEFGQAVPALPLHQLSRVALLPSLSGINGQRTNLGIANPHPFPVPVFISFSTETVNYAAATRRRSRRARLRRSTTCSPEPPGAMRERAFRSLLNAASTRSPRSSGATAATPTSSRP